MSTMKAQILDSRDDSMGKCYLCKIAVDDYIRSLPTTYQDYDIQREIVANVYLDHLVDTVLTSGHIPPIVLVVEERLFRQEGLSAEIETFKILDGLQRTFRLEAIYKTIHYCINELTTTDEYLSWSKFKFSRTFSAQLRKLNSNTDILRAVLAFKKAKGPDGLLAKLTQNFQWFEIWTGLTPEAEVRKMLTLNAGHKPVKTRHQLELLFLNLLPILRIDDGSVFKLVRERDISGIQFSKDRDCGTFHFAHIITSLLSFYEGKPVAPSTDLIQSIQASDNGIEAYSEFTSPEFLKEFVLFLVSLDKLLGTQYPISGPLWMGREVTLAGLFGALGDYAKAKGITRQTVMTKFLEELRSKPNILDLDQFETQRNTLDLSKVNFGNVNRSAIFSASRALLEGTVTSVLDWRHYFGVEVK